jgi:acetolactate synthase-1/3 small subunit
MRPQQPIERHTMAVLVDNEAGVLARVIGLFSGRGYNIDSLNVAPTHDSSLSRMTIVTRGDDATVEQIVKQLGKLIDVVKVIDYRQGDYIDRELVLLKVATGSENRAEVAQMAELFRAKVVDVQPDNLTIEITGGEGKIEKFITLMKGFGILDLTRTGQVALPRA